MSATDYTALDAAILQAIVDGKTNFTALIGSVERMADGLAKPDPWGKKVGWRLADRRLQALRKAGKIVYSAKHGWSLAKVSAA